MSIFTGSGVAVVTPLNADESVNYNKLDELLDYHCNHKTDSIIICGTTGESSTLSEEEQKIIGSFFRQLDNLITLHQHECYLLDFNIILFL